MTEIDNQSTRAIWKRRWFRVISIVLILFAAILIATPYIISSSLKSYLLDNGADSVNIEDIDFNPFTGTAAVTGLDVRIADKKVISNSRVYLDVSLLALLKKGVAIEAATIEKLEIDIEQTAAGKYRIGSLTIDSTPVADDVNKEEIKKTIAWWLGLGKVTLNASVIRYTSPSLTTTLFLDSASVQNMSTRAGDQNAKIDIKARLNKSDIKASILLHELSPEFKADGSISLQQISLNDFSGLTADILDKLSGLVNASGKLSVSVSQSNAVDITYNGNTTVGNADVSNSNFAVDGTALQWDGKLLYSANSVNDQQAIKLDGALKGTALAVSLPQILTAKGNMINWQGTVDYANTNTVANDATASSADHTGSPSSSAKIKVDGKLQATELSLMLAEQNLLIQQQAIRLDPQLSLQLAANATNLSGTASLSATATRVEDTAKALTLLAMNELELKGINAEALDKVKVDSILIQQAGLIQSQKSEQPTIAINSATVTDIHYTDHAVAINNIAFGKLTGSFVREKDGSLDISNELQTAEKPASENSDKEKPPVQEASPVVAEESASSNAFPIKISEISVKDDSIITFTDKTVSPAFKSVLDIASLKINDIDSSKADQPIAIDLSSKLNNYASLTVKGSVTPFKQQAGVDLAIKLENQNMVALSPYVIAATGYLVHAGQLNLDSKVVIKDGSIDAQNTLFMKKLKLEEADANIVQKQSGTIGLPLDKALGMLRDKNDNIKLDVPISGKLDEVDIGTGQIISLALKKATTAGMKTYLLYAFQPYGALIMVGQAIGKEAGKINLDPVIFTPGNSELDSKQKDYLEKLGTVMLDRPKIDVQICAYTTAMDLSIRSDPAKDKKPEPLSQKQSKKSLKIGMQRQKAIKDYLISKFKIDNSRLVLCSPEYDDSKDAKPRVELLI